MTAEELAAELNRAVRDSVVEVKGGTMPSVTVRANRLVQVCSVLKEQLGFDYLVSVTGVDYYDYFEVVYHLHSVSQGHQACLKVTADHQQPTVPSVVGVWRGADLQEREVYDLMGISFTGHPNLKRVLLWDEFVGHPLRKDFGLANPDDWQQAPRMPRVEP